MCKVILDENIEKDIVSLYSETQIGIEKLCKIYSVGKLRIKDILKKYDVPIKRKGGQNMFSEEVNLTEFKVPPFIIECSENEKVIAICKKTGKEFNDYSNKSGALSKYYKENFPEIEIPTDNIPIKKYFLDNGKNWFEEYFDFKIKKIKETKKCPYCEWETIDLDNKSGYFQQHIMNVHKVSPEDHLNMFPDDLKYFTNIRKIKDREEKLSKNDTIKCEICGEEMLFIAGHLIKHGITISEYKEMFPESKILGLNTKELFSKNYKNINSVKKFTKNSKSEVEIKEFIKSLGLKTKIDRTVIDGFEIDIMIEELGIGIEYNGLYYHSDKFKDNNYHLMKTKIANSKGIKLIHIFEDEWHLKKELVKEKLKYILGKHDGDRIYARKLVIKEIKSELFNPFLQKNHIQGKTSINKVVIGGFYNNELVCVMSFGIDNMTKRKDEYWDLSRYCSKIGVSVVGGASKLLKYFIKNYNPIRIISFADRRWTIDSNNNLYTKLGFKYLGDTKPNYYYYKSSYDRYKRFNKYNFSKNKLKENYDKYDENKSEGEMLKEMGFVKIYNCGLFRYGLELNNYGEISNSI